MRKERLDCINFSNYKTQNVNMSDKSGTELVDYKKG